MNGQWLIGLPYCQLFLICKPFREHHYQLNQISLLQGFIALHPVKADGAIQRLACIPIAWQRLQPLKQFILLVQMLLWVVKDRDMIGKETEGFLLLVIHQV